MGKSFFFIIPFVLLISCGKNEHNLSSMKQVQPFEASPFVLLDYNEAREKLKEKKLDEYLARKLDGKFREEIQFKDVELPELSQHEFNVYREKEQQLGKVVLYNVDKVKVFFVPVGTEKKYLKEYLGLRNEEGRILVSTNYGGSRLQSGEEVSFLSLNHEDLIANDIKFFSQQFFHSDSIQLVGGEKLTVKVRFEHLRETLVSKEEVEGGVYCEKPSGGRPEQLRRNVCMPCSIVRDYSSGKMETVRNSQISELGFFYEFSGKEKVLINEASVSRDNLNEFSFDLPVSDRTVFKFSQRGSWETSYSSRPKNESGSCRALVSEMPMGRSNEVNFQFEVTVKGRGEKIREIKLF